MLVEKQVQRVKRRARRLPVVLLVEVAQRHRVGEDLVQHRDAFGPRVPRKRYAHVGQIIERLRWRHAPFIARLVASPGR
jgi:hypothetical protein